MKKLRLIKPWNLDVERQKFPCGSRIFNTVTVTRVSCSGPSGTAHLPAILKSIR